YFVQLRIAKVKQTTTNGIDQHLDAGKLADLKSELSGQISSTKSEILEKAEEIGFTKDEISSLEKAMEESDYMNAKSAVGAN
ncbi:MAG: hypothetical protein M0C28_39810, partial [Candidatus Moduliflexus flocculans]|nr:hypothetical protein [Candidatus Moduliflexus flocculans]